MEINLVTAVSRPENLPRLARSISLSMSKSKLSKVNWIVVVDDVSVLSPAIEAQIKDGRFLVKKVVHTGGRCQYGIDQKNLGLDSIKDGYYHCIDDDNILHPEFFQAIERAMDGNPGKKAFVFGQQRWDAIKSLTASPARMEYGKIDNSMFLVHSSLIGLHRYDLTRSGREDFHFFRKLYDLHSEQFVFLSETLAYYNFIRHFPGETPAEKPPKKTASDVDTAEVVQPVVRGDRVAPLPTPATPSNRPGILKIALYSSKRERCGISTYTSQLQEALAVLGHDVRYFGSMSAYDRTLNEVMDWNPNVFHVQHEVSIMPPRNILEKYTALMRREFMRVAVTLHTESLDTISLAAQIASNPKQIIMHRPSPDAIDVSVVPMPCTPIGPLPDKMEMRRKYGLPEDAFVISTVGFAIPWKEHPKIIEMMLPWLKERRNVHIQVIASEHFSEDVRSYASVCRVQIAQQGQKLDGEKRIHHVDGYPSDRELVERLVASDLGYVWCPFDTGSSSAAAAQFTTARCPLVATDSSHYAFLGTGIVRGPKGNMNAFVELIQKTADNAGLLEKLKSNQWTMYKERNYIETARKHLEIYKEQR